MTIVGLVMRFSPKIWKKILDTALNVSPADKEGIASYFASHEGKRLLKNASNMTFLMSTPQIKSNQLYWLTNNGTVKRLKTM